MPTYIVRPYFGHDCNSEEGFNNGHYLDDIRVDAASPGDAAAKAEEQFRAEHPQYVLLESEDSLGLFRDEGIEWVTGYSDDDGNSISCDEWLELNADGHEVGGYMYQYINFHDVTVVDALDAEVE